MKEKEALRNTARDVHIPVFYSKDAFHSSGTKTIASLFWFWVKERNFENLAVTGKFRSHRELVRTRKQVLLCIVSWMRFWGASNSSSVADLPGWQGSLIQEGAHGHTLESHQLSTPSRCPASGKWKSRQGPERALDWNCQCVGKAAMAQTDGAQGSVKAGRYLVLARKGCWVPSSLSCEPSRKLDLGWRSHSEPASAQHRLALCCMFLFSVLVR